MLILLPPSEGKARPESGRKLSAPSLGFAGLRPTRARVLQALIDLCSGDVRRAGKVLGLGPTQRAMIELNLGLRTAPSAPAIEVYTGVLYDALDFASLPTQARKRADARVAIASALFGLLRPSDRIPAYRLSADTTLPGLGALSTVWKEQISRELGDVRGPILDLRSSAYVALGPIPREAADRSFVGRVLLERGGKRSVVSHHNKATKGRLIRAVLQQASVPRSAAEVPDFLTASGFTTEVREPARNGDPIGLDIIVYQT